MTTDAKTLATDGSPVLAALRRDLIAAESATDRATWPNRADEVRAEIARVEAELAGPAVVEPEAELEQRKQARKGRKGRVEHARRAPQSGEAA